jgi:hypothetical protein
MAFRRDVDVYDRTFEGLDWEIRLLQLRQTDCDRASIANYGEPRTELR